MTSERGVSATILAISGSLRHGSINSAADIGRSCVQPRGCDGHHGDTPPIAPTARFPHNKAHFDGMELSGFEPLTSWTRPSRSLMLP
jgi:hypothetical protein